MAGCAVATGSGRWLPPGYSRFCRGVSKDTRTELVVDGKPKMPPAGHSLDMANHKGMNNVVIHKQANDMMTSRPLKPDQ